MTHHILLVEDNSADVFLMETSIEIDQVPMSLQVAGDGVVAMELLEQELRGGQLPELVLLDLNMPRMNGFEVLAALKASEALQTLPVVVFTTSTASIDRVRVQELGANAFLSKPSGFTEVAQLLQSIVDVLRGEKTWTSLATT
ncbi:response regulator rcp1 [Deinococcus xinjiangensis]|uniref:Response regulator rcp1 n=1 Tax=Deinococcus xinjiangensis TaxID=457454 RepID=A0ABP9V9C4_9DEIO